jgi:hypothetical protein
MIRPVACASRGETAVIAIEKMICTAELAELAEKRHCKNKNEFPPRALRAPRFNLFIDMRINFRLAGAIVFWPRDEALPGLKL